MPRDFQGLAGLLVLVLFRPAPDLHPQVHSQTVSSQQLTTTECQLKAVYLYNLLHFVTWPKKPEQAGETEPLIIGVVGISPVGDALDASKANLPDAKQEEFVISSYGPYRQGMDLSRCLSFLQRLGTEEIRRHRRWPARQIGVHGCRSRYLSGGRWHDQPG